MSEQPAVKVLMLKGEKGSQGNGISAEEMAQINSKIDSSVASAEKSIEEGLENRISKMNFVPVVLASESEIKSKYPNGADGLFIAGDTGHLWVFVSGNWKDCGQYQTAGLSSEVAEKINNSIKGIGFDISTASLVAPYDALDTLPLNSIVTYEIGIKENVKNAPADFTSASGGVVMTYTAKFTGGAVQLLVSQSQEMYYRICWGNSPTWSDWNKITSLNSLNCLEPHYVGQSEIDNGGSDYADLDKLIKNQVLVYALTDMSKVKNAPSNTAGTLIVSSASSNPVGGGEVQTFITKNKDVYRRIRWGFDGNSPTWSDWNKITSLNSLNCLEPHYVWKEDIDSGSDYADLDNFIKNQVLVYALTDMSKVKNAPSNTAGTLIVSSASNSPVGGGEVQTFITKNNDTYRRIRWGNGNSPTWGNWKRLDVDYKPTPSLAMFQKIGIVGDSYASGELVFGYGNNVDRYEISWGKILARKNGANAINFSRGGLSTRSWLADEKGLALLNSSDAQDLYICALGINDITRCGGESYIGSESDIDSSADTFYGNYGNIIKAIQTKAPNAKIVISTIASSNNLLAGQDSVIKKFNTAIETIAKHFGISLIKQADDPFFTSDYYLNHMQGEHPTGPVYSEMANAIERLISQQMVDNISYFETYKK